MNPAPSTPGSGQIRCHRCRSVALILRETRYEHAEYDGGLFLVDGAIAAVGEGFSRAGDHLPRLTEIECQDCGHVWRPRREFAGSL